MKRKKRYFRPVVEEIDIDNEISLMMTSLPPGDPGDDNPFGMSQAKQREELIFKNQNSPFGGDSPDYN
ncbi:hypothetical protein [Labilibacter marinus]|uniref:hypothetical protein n=1 Tax=Labilibacter marinus TaxID=1477105 RepID=UPI000829E2F0|nr:hypothetical protein [Labilibacter marinus]